MKGNKYFINEFDLQKNIINEIISNNHQTTIEDLFVKDLSFKINKLLTDQEVNLINNNINSKEWIPVGIDGVKKNYKINDVIGSYRLSCYEENLANALWERIKKHFPSVRIMKEDSPTEWDNHKEWEPIGINPLFRFIRYTNIGMLIPHYDAPFIENNEIRSLNSLVIYLTNNQEGGTRFIKDHQSSLPLHQRDYSDWNKEADNEDILISIYPSKGDAIVFDHRILHDSERINMETKIIIRTDIMYRKIK